MLLKNGRKSKQFGIQVGGDGTTNVESTSVDESAGIAIRAVDLIFNYPECIQYSSDSEQEEGSVQKDCPTTNQHLVTV